MTEGFGAKRGDRWVQRTNGGRRTAGDEGRATNGGHLRRYT
jgi:hypothetical protein